MIRDYTEADAEGVLALNEACQPEVGPMDGDKLAGFVEWAPYFKVVRVGGEVAGMLIGLGEDAPYGSPNFGWFVERYGPGAAAGNDATFEAGFAYIDRVAVSETQRGAGWGPALYRDFEQWAKGNGKPRMCAEVNIEPPNPRSLRFHDLYGFQPVDRFEPTNSPDYRVAMLVKEL